MGFYVGEEHFETLKQLNAALKELGYPHNVYVTTQQAGDLAYIIDHIFWHSDEAGPYMQVGGSRVRCYPGPALDTMDNPKWRKEVRVSDVGEKA